VVADKPTGKTIEDQRRAPWTLRYLVWDAKGEAGVQPAYGLLETPSSAIVYAVPEFIWRMSAKMSRGPLGRQNEHFSDYSPL
jgi:hypothetical protein